MKIAFNAPLFLAFLGLVFSWSAWIIIVLAVIGSFYWSPK